MTVELQVGIELRKQPAKEQSWASIFHYAKMVLCLRLAWFFFFGFCLVGVAL